MSTTTIKIDLAKKSGSRATATTLKRKKRVRFPVVVMGAGRLGESLLTLGTLSGFRIVGVFDKDPKRIGVKFTTASSDTHIVEPTVELASRVSSFKVSRGIICVPSSTAQEAADELVGAGINVILSYAPTDIHVPSNVVYSRIDPGTQFARMMPPPTPIQFFPWRQYNHTTRNFSSSSSTSGNNTLRNTNIGLARLPCMWTCLEEGPVSISINPVLLTLVGGGSIENNSSFFLDDETTTTVSTSTLVEEDDEFEEQDLEEVDEDDQQQQHQQQIGFFEFIQSNQKFFVAKPPQLVTKINLVGLETQYESLKESLLVRDDLFRTRGTLLFGPSGCGKSTLLKHTALQMKNMCFFFVSGEEDSLLNAFRAAARTEKSSVVVIENLDVVCRKRAFKTAFLSCADNPSFNTVSIIGSTNAPWELDTALLRHFERRTLIPLPDVELRALVLSRHFLGCSIAENLTNSDFLFAARQLEGYSISDVVAVAKDAGLKALKNGEGLTRYHLLESAGMVRPTFCKEVLPLFDSFSERFGTNNRLLSATSNKGRAYLSMYS